MIHFLKFYIVNQLFTGNPAFDRVGKKKGGGAPDVAPVSFNLLIISLILWSREDSNPHRKNRNLVFYPVELRDRVDPSFAKAPEDKACD